MNFADSLKYGSVGEFATWCFFNSLPNVKELIDVRDDKRFQQWDVDFLLLDTNRQVTFVEVKSDSKASETGNFVYEVTSNKDYNTIGCFEKTQAQMIAYYVTGSNNLYLLNVSALKNYVRNHELRSISMGDNALGYLLPISDLERYSVIIGMYNLNDIMKG